MALTSSALESLAGVPRIADQSGGVRDRLEQLGSLPGWPQALGSLTVPAEPEQIRTMLAGLADAATCRYLYYGHGNGIMLVHSATAPTAILRTLPALDVALWAPSLAAAWAASSALTAVYAPAEPAPRAQLPGPASAGESPEETASATYVANTGFGMGNGDTVTPFETATDRVGAPIEGLSGPIGIVITPDGKTAYVADSSSGTVTPIRVASNTAGKVIRVGSDPVYIAIAG